MVGGFSGRSVVVAMLRLLGGGKLILPSSFKAMEDPSMGCLVMARCGDGGPPWVESMAMASELSQVQERLRPPKRSAMNSRLPKRIILPREKPPHDRRSSSVAW
jgi:hypothetical protein